MTDDIPDIILYHIIILFLCTQQFANYNISNFKKNNQIHLIISSLMSHNLNSKILAKFIRKNYTAFLMNNLISNTVFL